MLRTAKQLSETGAKVRGVPITDELYDLILFTTHSFVRPTYSELYALKHSDVMVSANPKRLVLTIRNGKTGYRSVDTMEAAVSVYKRIQERHKGFSADDYLFFPQYDNRTTAVHIGIKQFDYLLKSIKLKQDIYTGKPFSLYALRHTALCMRLVLSGGQVNLFALARNAGTSVDMLERHYLRYLPNNEELARNIQIFSGQGQG